jgi:fumarylacetoacetase
MALGPKSWSSVRAQISELLRHDSVTLRDNAGLRKRALLPRKDVQLHMPFAVAGYTDFYSSKEHATNVGIMFRGKDNALQPNWLHIPIAYNGRASTVVVSGTPIVRPQGQLKPPSADAPSFGPCKRLDFELEMGVVVGSASQMGHRLTEAQAAEMIFGFVLLNDWSARDIQQWEYVPLGPFQAKAFGTSISPWVVTREALEPFPCRARSRIRSRCLICSSRAPTITTCISKWISARRKRNRLRPFPARISNTCTGPRCSSWCITPPQDAR